MLLGKHWLSLRCKKSVGEMVPKFICPFKELEGANNNSIMHILFEKTMFTQIRSDSVKLRMILRSVRV